MKRFLTIIVALTSLLTACINGETASVNDLYVGGIPDRRLLLDGREGCSKTFYIVANYDWQIIDYRHFNCLPSSGSKTEANTHTTITATTLQSNNTADTIRLSDLNFKLLNTRFVGISAYQLPQVCLKNGKQVTINAVAGAKESTKIVSKADDITLVVSGDISATLGKKNAKDEFEVNITATESNSSSEARKIGTIEFEIDGVRQGSKIEVIQNSAIIFDRSEVLLPSKAGESNMLVVNSNFDINAEASSDQFSVKLVSSTTSTKQFKVTALYNNDTSKERSVGKISVTLSDDASCESLIEVRQRKSKAPQTIIVHFVGTALRDYFDLNTTKILEALNADIQGDAQILAIYTNSDNNATLYELRYDSTLGKAVQEMVAKLSLPTPYNAALFEDNLRKALAFAPAEKYALVVGSHGLAWIPKAAQVSSQQLWRMGVAPSKLWERNESAEMTRHIGDKTDTQYNITELADAIAANGVKFEYILFDACFMGNVESAYELRNSTDYIIGSPCEILGTGFPYARVTPYMLVDGGTSYNLDKICSEYVNHYRTSSGTPSACVAVTATAELEALAVAMKAVNEAGVKEGFSLDNVQYYEGQAVHSFYDLGDMVEQSCANAEVAAAFKAQLDKTVTSRYHTDQFYSGYGADNKYYHDINYYSGISTSAMVEHYSTDWQQTAWYKATH